MAELVIFDCDGVLVDSDRISLRIQAERISALGLEMSYEECVRDFLGLGMPATLRILAERLEQPVPEGWEAELDAAVREGFRRELTPVPGIVQALEGIELPVCVASSGSHEKMRLTLGLTGLWDRFAGRIFSADEVKRGKPLQTSSYTRHRVCRPGRSDASLSRTARSASPRRGPPGCRLLALLLRPPLHALTAPTWSSQRWRTYRGWSKEVNEGGGAKAIWRSSFGN